MGRNVYRFMRYKQWLHSIVTWRQWIVHKNEDVSSIVMGFVLSPLTGLHSIQMSSISTFLCAIKTATKIGSKHIVCSRHRFSGGVKGWNSFHSGSDQWPQKLCLSQRFRQLPSFPALTFTKYDQNFFFLLTKNEKSTRVKVSNNILMYLIDWRLVCGSPIDVAQTNIWLTIGFGASSCWLYYFLVHSLRFKIFLVCARTSNSITFWW